MNHVQAETLNRKLHHLHLARPTIQPNANVQQAGNKPWLVTAPGGTNQIAFPIVGTNAVQLCAYTIQPGQSGALTGLVTAAVASDFVDNTGFAVWHLTINGAPVAGFENILSQLGSFGAGGPLGTYITLQENDLLQLWVAGPIFPAGGQPTGYASGLLTGYVCYGGQGTYVDPREQANGGRGYGQNRHFTGSDNGRPANSAAAGRSFNRGF